MSSISSHGLEALQPTHHGNWEPRRALTLNTARRRTAFVGLLRLVFIGAAVGIVALLLTQLILGNAGGPIEAQEAVSTDVRMINPRFTGRDENLTPYTVTADIAIRRRENSDGVTELQRPRLDYDFISAGDQLSQVLAETGSYDPTNRILDLNTEVNLQTDTGYTFLSQHARVHLRDQRVSGEQPVIGTGPNGSIRSDRYEILEGGNRVIFEGNVRAQILQDRTEIAEMTENGESAGEEE